MNSTKPTKRYTEAETSNSANTKMSSIKSNKNGGLGDETPSSLASQLSFYSYKYPPELDSAVVVQVERVDDAGLFGVLTDWGGANHCTAYLPIGSIGKEKGRGERKAQQHFLTKARRSLKHRGHGSGMPFVAFVQSIDHASRSGVADGSAFDIDQELYHVTVTRRGVTDEIEKATLDLSRDVQQCGLHLVDKAAALAKVSRRWARQVTMHAAYERANASAAEGDEEDEEEAHPEKAPVVFLVDTIGSLAADVSVQTVVDLLGSSDTNEERIELFASRLLSLCRNEKQRRSQPVSISVTAYIGGPTVLLQREGGLTPGSFDTSHLMSSFQSDCGPPPPDGCDPVSVRARGNGKYTLSTNAPPECETTAKEYLSSFAAHLQAEWLKSAQSPDASESAQETQPTQRKASVKTAPSAPTLSMQPSLNIGVIGDVANGKSTLVKAISGKRTQAHSSEQQKHGITIRLGFANAAVLQCQNETGACGAYSFLPESEDSGDASRLPVCEKCGHFTKVVARFSLIDCPGHAELMATMLAGASAFDAVILAAAANVPCPTPQARQHLEAIKLSGAMDGNKGQEIPSIAIAQTKAELLADEKKNAVSRLSPEERLELHAQQGRDNLVGTAARNAPIFPVCAPAGLGLEAIAEWIAHIPSPKAPNNEEGAVSPHLNVLRSFDINPANTLAGEAKGGVLGGTILGGGHSISIDDILEVRPGPCLNSRNGKGGNKVPAASSKCKKTAGSTKKKPVASSGPSDPFQVQPLHFRCTSLMTGKSPLSIAGSGGLIAVGTSLDPAVCADNKMVGAVVGPPGTLPPVWGPSLYCGQFEFVALVPDFGHKNDNTVKPSDLLVKSAPVRCHIGSSSINGHVARISKSHRKLELCLDGPVCAAKGANVAIEAKGNNGFVLVAHAKLFGGDLVLEGEELEDKKALADPDCGEQDEKLPDVHLLVDSDKEHRTRFLDELQNRNEEAVVAGGASRVSVPLPDIARDGGAHVLLSNFGLMAHALRRDPNHLMGYLQKEGGLSCVLAGERSSPATTALRVRWRGGRNFAERFTSIMRKYIKAYVTCQECRSAVTELNASKNEILCRRCNARRFVAKL
ncbi:Putative eukaryotic translation initiation factor 2 subunit 3-like protein [Seminavis robusta]|uniref:protein-synthesizing GTPase n=1 Tax=Seminavis robusta TaxID=568900 RepID=A0A9N8HRY5_9STRA|nr:Putative eukaryotic translation initiation factor 2 subunit 3-like protein [Seminavis robusta]|eukprot:Sro1453_g274010.1 Putative eukaryotic translation initiation factor 2 subunit 3-like protein (1090) ;mRNA; f:11561-14830